MAEGNKPFVVTDRRKFTMEGEIRPDAERPAAEPERAAARVPEAAKPVEDARPRAVEEAAVAGAARDEQSLTDEEAAAMGLPPAPNAEQMERARMAYEQTTERLDTVLRATNPGGEPPQTMNFEQMVNSFYMTAILQLGGATQEGQQPQVDILGARQSIDILAVLGQRTRGNLSGAESQMLESALFDARMAFLEVTQAIARSAAAKQGAAPAGPGGGMGLVR